MIDDIFDGSSHLSTIRDPQVIDCQMVFGTGFDTEILRDSPAMVKGFGGDRYVIILHEDLNDNIMLSYQLML